MLLVGDPQRWRSWFTVIRPLASVDAATPVGTYEGLVPETRTIWLLSGRNAPWAMIWASLRDLPVAPAHP